jgi:hypothetical protein
MAVDSHAAAPQPGTIWGRRSAAAVRFLLKALECYELLGRANPNAIVMQKLLGKHQVERMQRLAYEEFLWLADDVFRRKVDHRSGQKLTPESSAAQALVYLGQAESSHRPTQALYALRSRCLKAAGEEARG